MPERSGRGEPGTVEAIHLVARHGGPPAAVAEVVAEVGAGLRGDRHHADADGNVTLIEAEVLEELAAASQLDLADGLSRRNLRTRGVDLAGLVGRRFTIGDVLCQGDERCEPCTHLAGLTDRAVLTSLAHTGLRATIVRSGTIRTGDPIRPA
jgi:MOSC domain-containing protein YiiM